MVQKNVKIQNYNYAPSFFLKKISTFVVNFIKTFIMNNLLYINWDIDPVIFSLGPVKIQYYGLIFVITT